MKVFAYAFHKTASMFLYRYFKEMAALSGAAYFSINNEPKNESGWKECRQDFIVSPIRFREGALLYQGSDAQNVIHLRNPIDVLISQYFSFGFTHAPMGTERFAKQREGIVRKSIDEYCLEESAEVAQKYRTLMKMYDAVPNKILSDYSGMRDDFKAWNAHMCRAILPADGGEIEKKLYRTFKGEFSFVHTIASWFVRPKDILLGKKSPHRRDGGDNQKDKYLRPETVAKLEHDMKDVLEFYAGVKKAYEQEA